MLVSLIQLPGSETVFFAGCSRCGSVAPLWCSGRFMPHVPMAVGSNGFGPVCGFCGPMPPVFMCTVCGTVQGLYLPGMPPPTPAPGMGFNQPLVAPAIQASPGSSPSAVSSGLKTFLDGFLGGLGKEMGSDLGRQFGTWAG